LPSPLPTDHRQLAPRLNFNDKILHFTSTSILYYQQGRSFDPTYHG
jgi:hypothetical protein